LAASAEIVRFGTFELNLRTSELRKHGVKIRLQDQLLRVLVMLVERLGELVTRDEIQARLWPNDTGFSLSLRLAAMYYCTSDSSPSATILVGQAILPAAGCLRLRLAAMWGRPS